MKKLFTRILIFLFIFYTSFYITFAEVNNILYIKYPFTPVLKSIDSDSNMIATLNKWYVVLNKWEYWDYVRVLLTDNKEGYILALDDFEKLDEVLEKVKKFNPKKFESSTKNIIKIVENFIDNDWKNKT